MSTLQTTKAIKISWVAPNGRAYQDVVPMTLEQYKSFVDNLLKLKHQETQSEFGSS